MTDVHRDAQASEWAAFPGGELEGTRPKVLCPACRDRLQQEARGALAPQAGQKPAAPLCFNCYRATLERDRALKAAGELDTASDARFQGLLPFEPVNTARLECLKADRAEARGRAAEGSGQYAVRRRRAQPEARRALQAIFESVRARRSAAAARESQVAAAIHALELQLPEAWLPFVVSR